MKEASKSLLVRESNMELLRLVCMLMIVVHHFIIQPNNEGNELSRSFLGKGIDALCYIGVNCFVLISGWFGIKVKWKSFFGLFLCCSFYGFVSYLFRVFFDGSSFGRTLFYVTLLPFSHSQWWFINCYVILYLSAPLINLALEHITKNKFFFILILLTIVNVYFGSIMQTPFFNQDGYTASQLIYVYLIGGYLSKFVQMDRLEKLRWWLLVGYILGAMVWAFSNYVKNKYGIAIINTGYNNPFNLFASICFFLFMASFKFHNKVINYLASSALAVYLIQESKYFGHAWLYPRVGQVYDSMTLVGQLELLLPLSIVFFMLCVMIDQIRILFSKGVLGFVEKRIVDKVKHRKQ